MVNNPKFLKRGKIIHKDNNPSALNGGLQIRETYVARVLSHPMGISMLVGVHTP